MILNKIKKLVSRLRKPKEHIEVYDPSITIFCGGRIPHFPRFYIIKTTYVLKRGQLVPWVVYWTGKTWLPDVKKGLLYATFRHAAEDWKELRKV